MSYLISHLRSWSFRLSIVAVAFCLGSQAQGQSPRLVESDPPTEQEPASPREGASSPAAAPAGDTVPAGDTAPARIGAAPTDFGGFQPSEDSWPKNINEISVDIRQTEVEVPDYFDAFYERITRQPLHLPRWQPLRFSWQATELWHRPLYFDDVPLERYGQMHHPLIQPALSGMHFFGNVPLLPYKMGLDRPWERIATLGYYRPGSTAPPVGRRLPLEADAAGVEAAAWVGLILLLP